MTAAAVAIVTAVALTVLVVSALACVAAFRVGAGRSYPTFLVGRELQLPDRLPVFMYHDVGPARFRKELAHLRANGYETIGADTLVDWLDGRPVALPRRPVAGCS